MTDSTRALMLSFFILVIFYALTGCNSSTSETQVPSEELSRQAEPQRDIHLDSIRLDSLWRVRVLDLPDSLKLGTYRRSYPAHVEVQLFDDGQVRVERPLTGVAVNVAPSIDFLIKHEMLPREYDSSERSIPVPEVRESRSAGWPDIPSDRPYVVKRHAGEQDWKEVYVDGKLKWYVVEEYPVLLQGGEAWLEGTYRKNGNVLIMDLPQDTMMLEDSLTGVRRAALRNRPIYMEYPYETAVSALRGAINELDTSFVRLEHDHSDSEKKALFLLPASGLNPANPVLSTPPRYRSYYFEYGSSDLSDRFHKPLSPDVPRW